ncbi:hypothetical protein D3C86_1583700 [compost metagenome]
MSVSDFDLLGCPVSDYATGKLLGRVKCVVREAPSAGIARIALECATEAEGASWEEPLEVTGQPEPRSQHDYMVGQYATVGLSDGEGRPIVETGGLITPQVLDRARRAGLLHRLGATFAKD